MSLHGIVPLSEAKSWISRFYISNKIRKYFTLKDIYHILTL